jgi:anti-sigma factor RsiW
MALCNEIGPLLGAFEDGELEPNEMQEVARHLAVCASCEKDLSAITTLGRMLRDSAPEPPLDGFAQAVQSRIEHLRPPLHTRIARWFADLGERFGAGAGLVAAGAVAAFLAIVIATPLARNLVASGGQPEQVAATSVGTVAQKAVAARESLASAANSEPSAIISQLESSDPDVAVWTGPRRDTTVIWLPDQQH